MGNDRIFTVVVVVLAVPGGLLSDGQSPASLPLPVPTLWAHTGSAGRASRGAVDGV